VTAVRRWAWSTPAVPIAVTVVAVVAYLLRRNGSYARLGAALDSLLVTAAAVLDPDDTDTPALCTPLRRSQRALIHRITSGAVARRRGAAIVNSSPPAAPETGPTSPAS
jgi:4-amino-4-deoxy-L-arabinose transferase-like glycosyltransferase